MMGNLKGNIGWRSAQVIGVALVSLILIFFLFGWRLGNLTQGMSPAEAKARQSSSSINRITDNPVNAPHKIGQFIFQHFGKHGAFWMRSISVIYVLAATAAFYLLAKWWFGNFIAALSTLLFATTPWVITLARSGTADVTLLSPILIMFAYVWLQKSKTKKIIPAVTLVVLTAVSFYAPGVLWFVIISLIFSYRSFIATVKTLDRGTLALCLVLFLLILSPLILETTKNTAVAKPLLLIPPLWLNAVETAKSLAWSFSSLVFQTRQHYNFSVGRLPILDVLQIALILLGTYAIFTKARKIIAPVISLLVIGIVAATVHNNALLLMLALPSLCILAALGLRQLYLRWSAVFPHNPLPRGLAIVLMTLVVLSHATYGVRYALLAWPHASDTRKVYVLK